MSFFTLSSIQLCIYAARHFFRCGRAVTTGATDRSHRSTRVHGYGGKGKNVENIYTGTILRALKKIEKRREKYRAKGGLICLPCCLLAFTYVTESNIEHTYVHLSLLHTCLPACLYKSPFSFPLYPSLLVSVTVGFACAVCLAVCTWFSLIYCGELRPILCQLPFFALFSRENHGCHRRLYVYLLKNQSSWCKVWRKDKIK